MYCLLDMNFLGNINYRKLFYLPKQNLDCNRSTLYDHHQNKTHMQDDSLHIDWSLSHSKVLLIHSWQHIQFRRLLLSTSFISKSGIDFFRYHCKSSKKNGMLFKNKFKYNRTIIFNYYEKEIYLISYFMIISR